MRFSNPATVSIILIAFLTLFESINGSKIADGLLDDLKDFLGIGDRGRDHRTTTSKPRHRGGCGHPKDGVVCKNNIEYMAYGDIILPKKVVKEIKSGGKFVSTLNVAIDKKLRWPEGKITYEIDPEAFDDNQTQLIQDSMTHITETTADCITFLNRNDSENTVDNYLFITSGSGCDSFFGMIGGKQEVHLHEACFQKGTIVHEFGHAIGLFHMHNREDRDQYINVNMDNVAPDFKEQFEKIDFYREVIYAPYETQSIMHYGETAFSKDGKGKTMTSKTEGDTLLDPSDKDGLTNLDAYGIIRAYDCPFNEP